MAGLRARKHRHRERLFGLHDREGLGGGIERWKWAAPGAWSPNSGVTLLLRGIRGKVRRARGVGVGASAGAGSYTGEYAESNAGIEGGSSAGVGSTTGALIGIWGGAGRFGGEREVGAARRLPARERVRERPTARTGIRPRTWLGACREPLAREGCRMRARRHRSTIRSWQKRSGRRSTPPLERPRPQEGLARVIGNRPGE